MDKTSWCCLGSATLLPNFQKHFRLGRLIHGFSYLTKTDCREHGVLIGDGETDSRLDVFTRAYVHTGTYSVRQ